MTAEELAHRLKATRAGNGFLARCPAHKDDRASLSIGTGDDGRVVLHCHANCPFEAIVEALHLTSADLRPDRPRSSSRPRRTIVATYPYHDASGTLLYEVVRLDPKSFQQRRPDGAGGWIWNRDGTRGVLYRLPNLQGAARAFIVEGEKDCDALVAGGLVATTNAGGAGKWKKDYAQQLVAAGVREIIIFPDHDEPGRQHADTIARSCHAAGITAWIVNLPDLPAKGDVSDWLNAGHTLDELRALVESMIHPLPIRLAELLDDLAAFIRRYVVLTDDQLVLVVLWTAHTHTLDAFDATPYLQVTSATAEAGKTRLLEVLECVVARPWLTQRTSAAVLVRKTDREKPSLLLDESDAAFHGDREYAEALRGLLNAGYRRSGRASLCVGQGAALSFKDFAVFGAKAIAGIGELPDTVASRSIRIELQRRMKEEPVAKFRQRDAQRETGTLRRTLGIWSASVIEPLRQAAPEMPTGLRDRAEDVLEPLFAIADLAGGLWPDRARHAAVAIMTTQTTTNLNIDLLTDIRLVFEETAAEWMASKALIEALVKIEERPWATLRRGDKPITPDFLARRLKAFQIVPSQTEKARGYRRAAFEEAWKRYLPPFNPSARQEPNEYAGESPFSTRQPSISADGLKSGVSPINTGSADGLTGSQGGREADEPPARPSDPPISRRGCYCGELPDGGPCGWCDGPDRPRTEHIENRLPASDLPRRGDSWVNMPQPPGREAAMRTVAERKK